jgi:NADP-dependent 3-hydroxy acid dehydrogenase YdfG
MTNPANKTVLITGAGGGFGRQMVLQFRAAGAKLILTDINDQTLQSAIDDAGQALVTSVTADLASEEGCAAVVETCASFGAVPDILVNNAGIGIAGRLDHVPRDHWETLMQLNLMAPMRLCSELLPGMIERGSGHIVNISSIAGWTGAEGLSSYCASKFGLRGFGISLAAVVTRSTGQCLSTSSRTLFMSFHGSSMVSGATVFTFSRTSTRASFTTSHALHRGYCAYSTGESRLIRCSSIPLVQQARHAPAILVYARIVPEQLEYFQQQASPGVILEFAIFLHQLQQQLHGGLVILVYDLVQRQLM